MRIKGNVKMLCIFLLLVIFNFFFIILNNVIFIVFLRDIYWAMRPKPNVGPLIVIEANCSS
jgi:hypothetical protein